MAGIVPITAPLDGLVTGTVLPSSAAIHFPSRRLACRRSELSFSGRVITVSSIDVTPVCPCLAEAYALDRLPPIDPPQHEPEKLWVVAVVQRREPARLRDVQRDGDDARRGGRRQVDAERQRLPDPDRLRRRRAAV